MTQEKVTFLHFGLGRGRVTCALRWNPENAAQVEVGMAFCSPKDIFTKKRGRDIASGRLYQGSDRSFTFTPDPTKRIKEQVHELFVQNASHKRTYGNRIFDSLELPGWAFKK